MRGSSTPGGATSARVSRSAENQGRSGSTPLVRTRSGIGRGQHLAVLQRVAGARRRLGAVRDHREGAVGQPGDVGCVRAPGVGRRPVARRCRAAGSRGGSRSRRSATARSAAAAARRRRRRARLRAPCARCARARPSAGPLGAFDDHRHRVEAPAPVVAAVHLERGAVAVQPSLDPWRRPGPAPRRRIPAGSSGPGSTRAAPRRWDPPSRHGGPWAGRRRAQDPGRTGSRSADHRPRPVSPRCSLRYGLVNEHWYESTIRFAAPDADAPRDGAASCSPDPDRPARPARRRRRRARARREPSRVRTPGRAARRAVDRRHRHVAGRCRRRRPGHRRPHQRPDHPHGADHDHHRTSCDDHDHHHDHAADHDHARPPRPPRRRPPPRPVRPPPRPRRRPPR